MSKDSTTKAKVVFEADSTSLQKELDNVEKAVDKVKDTVEDAGDTASTSGGLFGKFGQDVKTGIGIGFGVSTVDMVVGACDKVKQFAEDTIQTTMDFEQSMSKVQAITGTTGVEFAELTKLARDLGATTAMSAQESADAMVFLGMAGWDTQQIMAGLPPILDLAIASGTDFATVADIVSDNLTAFGLTAEDATMYSDTLATAITSANVNMENLGEALKYIAPVASSAGVSMQETVAMTMMLGDAGIKGSQAGTTLRTVLINLSGANSEVTKTMKDLGIELVDGEGKTRSFTDIIADLEYAMKDMTDAEKTAIIEAIAGKEAFSGFSAIVDQGSDVLADYVTELENSDGACKTLADTMSDNLAGKVDEFQSAVADLQIELGNTFLPLLTKATEGFTDFVRGATSMWGTFVDLADATGTYGASMSDVSEKTKEALAPMEEYSNKLNASLTTLQYIGIVSDETYTSMTEDVATWAETSIGLLDQSEREGLELMKKYSQEYILASDEEKAQMEANHSQYYENKRNKTNEWEEEITGILNTAKENNVALTQEEQERIKTIMSLQQKEIIKAVSDSYSEQEALLTAFKGTAEGLNVEMASEIMKRAKETKESTVQLAKERFEGELAWANEQRKVGDITDEEYAEMVKSAQQTYEDIKAEAEKGFTGVKEDIINNIVEAGGTYNEETGKLMDAHGNVVQYMNESDLETEVVVATAQAEKDIKAIQDKISNIKGKTVNVEVNTKYTTSFAFGGLSFEKSLPNLNNISSVSRLAVSPLVKSNTGGNTVNYNGNLIFQNKSDIDYFMRKTARAIERKY